MTSTPGLKTYSLSSCLMVLMVEVELDPPDSNLALTNSSLQDWWQLEFSQYEIINFYPSQLSVDSFT